MIYLREIQFRDTAVPTTTFPFNISALQELTELHLTTPILLAFPEATILSFDERPLQPVAYETGTRYSDPFLLQQSRPIPTLMNLN